MSLALPRPPLLAVSLALGLTVGLGASALHADARGQSAVGADGGAPAGDAEEAGDTGPGADGTADTTPRDAQTDAAEADGATADAAQDASDPTAHSLAARAAALDARERALRTREARVAARERALKAKEKPATPPAPGLTAAPPTPGAPPVPPGAAAPVAPGPLVGPARGRVAAILKKMKPRDAAKVVTLWPDDVALDVLWRLKPRVAAPTLGAMKPQDASRLTAKMARGFGKPLGLTETGTTAGARPRGGGL